MSDNRKNSEQRLRDRKQPEYTQAKGHNKRVRDLYPEAWAESTITDRILADWIKEHKADTCPYCTGRVKEVDHRAPLSKGGTHSLDNLEMLCMPCNREKGDKSVEEFQAYRLVNPVVEAFKPTDEELRPGGRYRTLSLFRDLPGALPPLWTIEEFKCRYLTIADPTEYQVAIQLLGSWKHWQKLSSQKFLQRTLKELRSELKIKLRSAAVQRLLTTENVAAVKLLATEDLDFLTPAPRAPVGRPNKIVESLDESEELTADMLRIQSMN